MGGRHHPIGIACHEYFQPVYSLKQVNELRLDQDGRLGHKAFKSAFARLVTRPEGLVHKQEQDVDEVAVEPSCKVDWITDLQSMMAENAMQDLTEGAFPGSLWATQDNSYFGVKFGILDGTRHPADQPAAIALVSGTDHLE
jgi:hypothetical protein